MKNIINVEVKSRCLSQDAIQKKLISLGAEYKGIDHQTDTYFNTPNGRLKLRQGNIENSLIFYDRKNTAKSRESTIILEKLSENNKIGDILSASIGKNIVVDKQRQIYFIDNIKFHIDEVKGLGAFVEIEAIDIDRTHSKEKLKTQCDYYINALNLFEKDFIEYSYSDLVKESFEDRFLREAKNFLILLAKTLSMTKFEVDWSCLDHLCYRVSTMGEYSEIKGKLGSLGELLIESTVGERLISTFKLNTPITFNNTEIFIIELPMPKLNNKYATGFEHAEFVISDSFDEIRLANSSIDFDITALGKKINPDLRIEFTSGQSIKLHHQSLEDVIKYEKSVL